MRLFFCSLFIFIFLFLPSLSQNNIPIEIIKIYDGDTIRAKLKNGNKFNIRLVGLDCYETSKIHRAYKQAYIDKLDINDVIDKGLEAKKYLKKLHKKANTISFNFMGLDKYTRVLGILYFENENINQKLVNENYCKVYEFRE